MLGIFGGLRMAWRIVFLAGFSLLMAFGLGTSYMSADPEGAGAFALGLTGATVDEAARSATRSAATRKDPEEAAADRADQMERLMERTSNEDREYIGDAGDY